MKDTILYIDDEKENLESFQLAFWSAYNVLLAKNTNEAEALMTKNEVKLVITDQKMAEETGIAFIERIKPIYPDTIFSVLTAYAELETVLDAINTGVYRFIQKPWDQKEMHQSIINAIDKYNLQKENKELLLALKEKNIELKATNDDLLMLARKFREGKREIEEREKLLSAIFKNIPLIVLLVNANREIIKINKTGLETSGKSEEQIIGIRAGDIFDCINSGEKPGGCGASEACKGCLINSTILNSIKYKTDYYKIEGTISIKRGINVDERKILISATYIDGKVPSVLVSLDDVTDHKEIIALRDA